MGRMQASEMARLMGSSDTALLWHLQSNHYPPVITKRVFIAAANQVLQIVQGRWIDEHPDWVDASRVPASYMAGSEDRDYTRAVQTAEAYIILFRAFNSRFDEKRFLIACGLADAPAKPKRARKAGERRRVISDEDRANARPGTENE